jgi:GntR family transcriptional repressor for pyruvate dehydrogenase complex
MADRFHSRLPDVPEGAPIARRRIYEELADRLIALIGSGRWRPGDPVPPEREISRAYGVGRSSVREALRILESRGLIRPVGGSAFVVADYGNPLNHSLDLLVALRAANLAELFEVRKILEGELAALAAQRRTDEHLQAMADAIEEMRRGLADRRRYITSDLRFHLTVAAASGNRLAHHMMEAIRGPLQDALASIYHIPGSAQRSIAQHEQIRAAIARGDPQAARARMMEHLQRVEGDVRAILEGATGVPAGERGG